jgi:hypothetical protein
LIQTIQKLAESIRKHGILDPIVISADGYILSGHRMYCAAKVAGLDVIPVRVVQIRRDDDLNGFVELLREYNRQRDESFDEKLREELVNVDPEEAYWALNEHRRESSRVKAPTMQLRKPKRRKKISAVKSAMLAAAIAVINGRIDFWELSVRSIQYALLNDPPLKNTGNPKSRYQNDEKLYNNLVDLLSRARLEGSVP